jgi:hypothetical protein
MHALLPVLTCLLGATLADAPPVELSIRAGRIKKGDARPLCHPVTLP